MPARVPTLLAALALLTFTAAGCGDDESTPATTDAPAAAKTTETTAKAKKKKRKRAAAADDKTSTTTTETTAEKAAPTATTTTPKSDNKAVDDCLAGVEGYRESDERKDELRDLCKDLEGDDWERLREGAVLVCEQITPADTPEREISLARCEEIALIQDLEDE